MPVELVAASTEQLGSGRWNVRMATRINLPERLHDQTVLIRETPHRFGQTPPHLRIDRLTTRHRNRAPKRLFPSAHDYAAFTVKAN